MGREGQTGMAWAGLLVPSPLSPLSSLLRPSSLLPLPTLPYTLLHPGKSRQAAFWEELSTLPRGEAGLLLLAAAIDGWVDSLGRHGQWVVVACDICAGWAFGVGEEENGEKRQAGLSGFPL